MSISREFSHVSDRARRELRSSCRKLARCGHSNGLRVQNARTLEGPPRNTDATSPTHGRYVHRTPPVRPPCTDRTPRPRPAHAQQPATVPPAVRREPARTKTGTDAVPDTARAGGLVDGPGRRPQGRALFPVAFLSTSFCQGGNFGRGGRRASGETGFSRPRFTFWQRASRAFDHLATRPARELPNGQKRNRPPGKKSARQISPPPSPPGTRRTVGTKHVSRDARTEPRLPACPKWWTTPVASRGSLPPPRGRQRSFVAHTRLTSSVTPDRVGGSPCATRRGRALRPLTYALHGGPPPGCAPGFFGARRLGPGFSLEKTLRASQEMRQGLRVQKGVPGGNVRQTMGENRIYDPIMQSN